MTHDFLDIHLPRLAAPFLPGAMWRISSQSTPSYALTFDDGPVEGVTDSVLEILHAHGEHATFFVLGRAAERRPDLVRRILQDGHAIATHGYAHLNPWRTPSSKLISDVRRSIASVQDITGQSPVAFRPPYGRIRPALERTCRTAGIPIVMWDILAGDFRPGLSARDVATRTLRHIRSGSIVVLHDNDHAGPTAVGALPSIIRGAQARGLRSVTLSEVST